MLYRAAAEMAVENAAAAVLNMARQNAPVATGTLRASGAVSRNGTRAEVRFSAPYAAIIHEKQTPFLKNALESADVPGLIARAFPE